MFDYYALPTNFQGMPMPANLPSIKKSELPEQALANDIIETAGKKVNPGHFIPYIQTHEFESLLFSDPQALAEGI